MNGTQAHVVTHETVHETRSTGIVGGSILEGFGAIATIALAIVGLAGVFPLTLAAIAAIVVGAATLVESGAFGLKGGSLSYRRIESQLFEGAAAVDFQGGLAVVVLGILALLGIAPQTLLSVSVIALGATFLLSGRLLIGMGATVLGILSVVGFSPLTLVLVGLLISGAGLLFSGSAMAATTMAERKSQA